MAILSFFQCEILVKGVALREYDDDDVVTEREDNQPGLTSVKYVEAISGAEFSVGYGLLSGWTLKEDLAIKIFLDGKHSQTNVYKKAELVPRAISWVENGIKLRSCNDWYLRRYQFADIVLEEVANHLSPSEIKVRYSGLGKVRVEVWSYKFNRDQDDDEVDSSLPSADLEAVPEKALKGQALSICTSLGPPVRSRRVNFVDGTHISQLASFDFMYRTKEALQQLMIIPPPLPLEDRPIEELTVEEARELLRRQRAQTDASAKTKAEAKTNLKRERSSTTTLTKPAKIARTADGRECIDLASDSDDGGIKPDKMASSTNAEKRNDEIEVIDLL